jgi:hypothetical protein
VSDLIRRSSRQTVFNDTGGSITGLPVGAPGDSTAWTGPALISSYPSDDTSGGTDGTGRLSLYSYQRANTNLFGEVVRSFLMRYDAKAMFAWYGPSGLYDGNGNPVGSTWHPWTWIGSHYEANDHASIHGHWEVEIPDSTGAMQGRFEILFANQTTGAVGLDKTAIKTNLADFNVRTHGTDHTGASQQQELRLSSPAGWAKPITFSNDENGAASGQRWKVQVTSDAETGSNAGSNIQIARYDDTGILIDNPITINRQTGQVSISGSAVPGNVSLPTDFGYAAWTYDPIMASNSTAPTGGVLYLSRIQIRSTITVSKVALGVVSVSGMSLTSGQCFIGIYDSTGAKVATTADLSATITAAGEIAVSLASSITLNAGFYWAGILLNGTTPTIARCQGQINNLGSGQLTSATRRFGSYGSTQTSLPTSLTLSSIGSVTTQNYWFSFI